MLKLYNSLTKKKEVFTPIVPNEIGIYTCGVTVYDLCHIGHARTYVAFDMIIRYFRYRGYKVHAVRNITDIDDKIIKRAQERNTSTEALVEDNIVLMNDHFSALGILPPDTSPRATRTIGEMIDMISTLIEKGFAYVSGSGDVLYRVNAFETYGGLSGQNIAALNAGARVEVDEHKESPLDFVLWKPAKPDEPSWPSPWGNGRPGWHIECSAMTKACLGERFDIHAGGSDLRFPHHENEIAQSEAANGCKMANYWLHSGMVQVNNEKMSKSLGNFFTIADVLEEYPAEVVRTFLLMSHYRSEIHYSDDNLHSAKEALTRLYGALRGLPDGTPLEDSSYEADFCAAMDDDMNSSVAFAVLFQLVKDINKAKETNSDEAAELGATLRYLAGIMGLLQQDPEDFFQSGNDVAQIEALIEARVQARLAKDWGKADEIRDALTAMGVSIEDTAEGTLWKR